jgi:hypothetical protein
MTDLERTLTQLGRELDYPPTPDLAAGVRERLHTACPAASLPERIRALRRGRRFVLPAAGLRRSLALALIALLVLAGGVFAAVPSVRDAVLEFFGLQGATVERRERLPAAPELRPLQLGERTTLAGAADALGFSPLVPADPGRPDSVFVRRDIPGGELSLAYRPRSGLPEAASTGLGLLVSEFRGDLVPEYVGKLAAETTRIERLRLGGERAIWIEGTPHFFFYRRPDGTDDERSLRLAANVLLLEQGDVLVRLEGGFGRERALEIARSLRPASG